MPEQESVARNVVEGVKQVVGELNLEGIPPERVLIRRSPALQKTDPTPCVIVSFGVEQFHQRGVNELDLTNYNVLVTIIAAATRTVEADAKFWQSLAWRQQVRRGFSEKRLSEYGVSLGGIPWAGMKVQAGESFIKAAYLQQLDAQFLVITVPVNEERTQ